MKVGILKEIKAHKYRASLTLGVVREYVVAGDGVIVKMDAGAGIWRNGQQSSSGRKGRNCEKTRSNSVSFHLAPDPKHVRGSSRISAECL
ncbi:hypothetical protein IVA95_28685 [Bradyrhizobium sp. 157]|nr:hypothetical protein [Bradyrhizobium sp. 157]